MKSTAGGPSGSKRTYWKNHSAMVGVAAAALSVITGGVAWGQDVIQTPPPAPTAEAEEEDTIVVTGSRLRTSEFNSPSPIQVITTERAENAGMSDVAELLRSSSLAAGSPQNDATISSAFVTEGGPGSETVSLRGLDSKRTLVLVNGRRGGPAGVRGQVAAFDLNVLPLSIIDRVEILKDGASSVYGSDAIAGVINFITKEDFEGGEVNFFASEPWDPNGEQFSVSGTYGWSFSRGYFNATVDYNRQYETRNRDRKYTDCAAQNTYDAATGARNDLVDPRTNRFACRGNTLAGQVWLYDYSDDGAFAPSADSLGYTTDGAILVQYDPTGQLGSFSPGSIWPTQVGASPTVPANWFGVSLGGDLGSQAVTNYNPPAQRNAYLTPERERTSIFLQGGYDVTSNVEVYAEVLLNRRETRTNGYAQVWTYLYSGDLDPFNVGWGGDAGLSPTPVHDFNTAQQIVDYTNVVTGLRGSFAGWLGAIDWDVYYKYSNSDAEYSQDVTLADAVDSAQFRTGSCVGTFTPVSNRPCIDVDWMSAALMSGAGFTPAEEAFLFDYETGKTEYTQEIIEAYVAGDIFTLPAGNVGAVVGAAYRTDEINDVPGEVTLAGNAWGASSAGITRGEDTTQEVFGEFRVPVLKDLPAIEELTLTMSGRYTDVESYGEDKTYKFAANWQVTPEWRVRYTRGTSFRAPALFELYLADQTSFARQRTIDPCINWGAQLLIGNISQAVADNCAADGVPDNWTGAGASAEVFTGGGAGLLEAERSRTWVAGLVWTPHFANLNVALDYFDIRVDDEVDQLGARNIIYGCYQSDNFASEPLCNLFTRGQTASPYLIATINDSYLNVNTQTQRGLDLTFTYLHEFPFGDLTIQGQSTWQFEDQVSLFEGTVEDRNGENGNPDWTGNIEFLLDRGGWGFYWGIDMIGAASDREDVDELSSTGLTRYDLTTEFTAYHSVSVTRTFDTWSFIAGIRNLSDEAPPSVTTITAGEQDSIGNVIQASQYDYLGRRVFVRVSKTF